MRRVLLAVSVVLVCHFFSGLPLWSAEVYYLGADTAGGSRAAHETYTFSQRIRDLFDFSGREQSERSGGISGVLNTQLDWQKVSGNKDNSFLENGENYNFEMNLNVWEKLHKDYRFEGIFFMRKTDDGRVEKRRDVRLKQMQLKVYNDDSLYEFGDFYADFSSFVLSNSLEGFHLSNTRDNNLAFQAVAARSNRADTLSQVFQRNVIGTKFDITPKMGLWGMPMARLGIQGVTISDDSSTLNERDSTPDIRNTVIGVDGEFTISSNLLLAFEMARSGYIEDEDMVTTDDRDQQYGNAFRVQPQVRMGSLSVRYLFYYVEPRFYTDSGSAASDKHQHQINIDYAIDKDSTLSYMYNVYWDNLSKSTKTKTTTYRENNIVYNTNALFSKEDLSFRPYINYLTRNSDDTGNTLESSTIAIGFSINNRVNDSITYGFGYEFREYMDEASKSASEFDNKMNFNVSVDSQFAGKRVYQNLSPTFSIKRTKRDDNHDASIGLSWNGQVDLTESVKGKWGYNIQQINLSSPDRDYINNRNFVEFDFELGPEKQSTFSMILERNHFNSEDSDEDYNETRVIARLALPF